MPEPDAIDVFFNDIHRELTEIGPIVSSEIEPVKLDVNETGVNLQIYHVTVKREWPPEYKGKFSDPAFKRRAILKMFELNNAHCYKWGPPLN